MFRSIAMQLLIAVLVLSGATTLAQQTRQMTFNAETTTFIEGFNLIIVQDGDSLKVAMVPPENMRPEKYQGVDIKEGDFVAMCNGVRVKDTKQLDSLISELAVGDEIKFGVSRAGKLHLVKFPKGDQSDQGGGMVVTRQIDMGDDGGMDIELALLSSGVVIAQSEGGLSVHALMPDVGDNIKGDLPAVGDKLQSVNGNTYTTVSDLQEALGKIAVGDPVVLELSRDGKTLKTTYTKVQLNVGETVIEN